MPWFHGPSAPPHGDQGWHGHGLVHVPVPYSPTPRHAPPIVSPPPQLQMPSPVNAAFAATAHQAHVSFCVLLPEIVYVMLLLRDACTAVT